MLLEIPKNFGTHAQFENIVVFADFQSTTNLLEWNEIKMNNKNQQLDC